MIKLKIKKLVMVDYAIFVLCIGLAWLYFIPTPHHLTTTIDQIDSIKAKFQRMLDVNVEMKVENTPSQSNFITTFNEIIKVPLESKEKIAVKSQDTHVEETPNVFLSIECLQNPQNNIMEVLSLTEFGFKGDCKELETSKQLQREVKRVMFSFTSRLPDDIYLNLSFGVVHFNVYIIVPLKDQNSTEALKKRIIDIAVPFAKKIGLPQRQYRLNFQTIFLEDIELPFDKNNKDSFGISVKDLDQFMDNFPSISQEQIYNFESEDVNLYIFADKRIHFTDEDGNTFNYFDEKKEKYSTIAIDSKNLGNYDIMILRILYRMFELTTLQDLSTSLESIKLEYQSNAEFSLFNAKRSKILVQRIIDGLESFKYLIQDTELTVEKDVGERIDTQIQGLMHMDIGILKLPDLQSIYQIIWSLNHDGNHKFGYRDSFADDYRVGIYLPLLLPFVYPLLRIIAKLKKK